MIPLLSTGAELKLMPEVLILQPQPVSLSVVLPLGWAVANMNSIAFS